MPRLTLPEKLTADIAFEAAATLRAAETPITIDVGALHFATPFGALVLASELRSRCAQTGHPCRAVGIDLAIKAHSYLAHTGFFRAAALSDLGNAPGEADPEPGFVPITLLTRDALEAECNGRPLGDAIQRYAQQLAVVLAEKNKYTHTGPVAYCLREVIRNVFEHAHTDTCLIAAQRWGSGHLQVTVADAGRGLRASLAERHDVPTDADALALALRPGISRADLDARDEDDKWANSGFGLYVISELGRRLGGFTLASGTAALTSDGTRTPENVGERFDLAPRPAAFHGTALMLDIKRPKGVNFPDYVERIINEGEAHTGTEGQPRRASHITRAV